MCGIVGIVSKYSIKELLYKALYGLQHRGGQAAGMATMNGNLMYLRKGVGLIKQVISIQDLSYLEGNLGIAHVRYPTAGSNTDPDEAHPFYVNSPYGIMLAHNGNLINTNKLRDEVLFKNHRHVRTQSDSEILTNVLAHELDLETNNNQEIDESKIFSAVSKLHNRTQGGYAVVALIANYGLLAFRDPYAIRPLVLGERLEAGHSISYILASESCTLNINGFKLIRDILPGEAVIIKPGAQPIFSNYQTPNYLKPCIFEYAYLARADSIMDKVSINQVRKEMGIALANKISNLYPNLDVNLVIGVPDTARTIALSLAQTLSLPYQEGLVKNHLFQEETPSEYLKEKDILNQLSPIENEIKNKNILLVDISIVRGSNSRAIVKILKKAGAKKIYLAVASPPIKYTSIYGVAMPVQTELLAYNKDLAEITTSLGVDLVIYQDLENLKKIITKLNPELTQFEASCFDGEYIKTHAYQEYLANLHHA